MSKNNNISDLAVDLVYAELDYPIFLDYRKFFGELNKLDDTKFLLNDDMRVLYIPSLKEHNDKPDLVEIKLIDETELSNPVCKFYGSESEIYYGLDEEVPEVAAFVVKNSQESEKIISSSKNSVGQLGPRVTVEIPCFRSLSIITDASFLVLNLENITTSHEDKKWLGIDLIFFDPNDKRTTNFKHLSVINVSLLPSIEMYFGPAGGPEQIQF